MRRDFVANVSHELKTPIGALGLLAETMAGEEDAEMLRRLADRVLHEAERLERTVEDLLDLSILEAQESPERELVAVDLLMADAAERMAASAEAAGIPIELTEPAGDILVSCDRRQVTSALFNLLDNAVKYSEEGGKVEFSAQVEGFTVAISVRDHGIGIPAPRPRTDLRTLLPGRPHPQPGHRRDGSRPGHRAPRRPGPPGRGLRRIAGGPGSTFRSSCRWLPPAAPYDGPGGRLTGQRWLSRPPFSSSTTSRATVTPWLSRSGVRDSSCRWRPTASRPSSASTPAGPALVLLDVMLPRMSGIDVCRELRAKSRVPIIMLTAKRRRDRHGRRARGRAPTTT